MLVASNPGDPMKICPVAIAVGCKKCPVFNVCPAKGVIGDYKPEEPAKAAPAAAGGRNDRNKKKK